MGTPQTPSVGGAIVGERDAPVTMLLHIAVLFKG